MNFNNNNNKNIENFQEILKEEIENNSLYESIENKILNFNNILQENYKLNKNSFNDFITKQITILIKDVNNLFKVNKNNLKEKYEKSLVNFMNQNQNNKIKELIKKSNLELEELKKINDKNFIEINLQREKINNNINELIISKPFFEKEKILNENFLFILENNENLLKIKNELDNYINEIQREILNFIENKNLKEKNNSTISFDDFDFKQNELSFSKENVGFFLPSNNNEIGLCNDYNILKENILRKDKEISTLKDINNNLNKELTNNKMRLIQEIEEKSNVINNSKNLAKSLKELIKVNENLRKNANEENNLNNNKDNNNNNVIKNDNFNMNLINDEPYLNYNNNFNFNNINNDNQNISNNVKNNNGNSDNIIKNDNFNIKLKMMLMIKKILKKNMINYLKKIKFYKIIMKK